MESLTKMNIKYIVMTFNEEKFRAGWISKSISNYFFTDKEEALGVYKQLIEGRSNKFKVFFSTVDESAEGKYIPRCKHYPVVDITGRPISLADEYYDPD